MNMRDLQGFWIKALTVGDDVGIILPEHHQILIDTVVHGVLTQGVPIHVDRIALKEIGEEESYGPESGDANVGPYGYVDECALEDAVFR